MKIDKEILLEIEDYIKHLDETIGLKPETIRDIDRVISKYKRDLNKSQNKNSIMLDCKHYPDCIMLMENKVCGNCMFYKQFSQ